MATIEGQPDPTYNPDDYDTQEQMAQEIATDRRRNEETAAENRVWEQRARMSGYGA